MEQDVYKRQQYGRCGEIYGKGAGYEPQQGGHVRRSGKGIFPQPGDRGYGSCGAAGIAGFSVAERKGMAGACQCLYSRAGKNLSLIHILFYYVRGKLVHVEEGMAAVECAGVAFALKTTNNTLSKLPALQTEVTLYTYFLVREGAMELYGLSLIHISSFFLHSLFVVRKIS